jgi:hypothetical protein
VIECAVKIVKFLPGNPQDVKRLAAIEGNSSDNYLKGSWRSG